MMAKFTIGILLVILAAAAGKRVERRDIESNPYGPNDRYSPFGLRQPVFIVDQGELGKFSNGYPFNSPPYERIFNPLPSSRTDIGTEFRFFSPTNEDEPQYISNMNFSLWNIKDSGFKRVWKTFFLIHGYNGGNAEWQVNLKNALLKKMKCNVFVVDWSEGDGPIYEQAVANIRIVGAEVGLFIQRLVKKADLDPLFVHIIGHSLGAHASGYAGKWFRRKEKTLVSRISGLDPAGPYFNGVHKDVRLDKGDADFVDVIHTNLAGNRLSGYGLEEAIGHVDFYPNGGEDQPGCKSASEATAGIVLEAASYLNVWSLAYKYYSRGTLAPPVEEKINDLSCSHGRSYEYYTASVEDPDCKFLSLPCNSWEGYIEGACGSCNSSK
ncbi:Pancreatic lipase-related protein 2, partial [Stegodyphus mimosarum]